MTEFWILILITMYAVEPGGRWVSAQSLTEPPVYQPDKELSVDIGESATLRCCVSKNTVGLMALFKQPNRAQPQIILKVFRNAGRTFNIEFQNGSFQTKTDLNCFNVIISNITQSDEAMYYCALTSPDLVFADGTYLKIKGVTVTTKFETSKPVVCELHGNTTNINTQVKTVLGLGTALGLCVLLIFSLTCILLRRRKCNQINTSMEDSRGTRQDSDSESLNYAALQFSKRKTKTDKRKAGPKEECVYSSVNKTVQLNINYP